MHLTKHEYTIVFSILFINIKMARVFDILPHGRHGRVYPAMLTHIPLDKMVAILADGIFKCISLNENLEISIEISLKFVPMSPIDNKPAPLAQEMAAPNRQAITWTSTDSATTHIYIYIYIYMAFVYVCLWGWVGGWGVGGGGGGGGGGVNITVIDEGTKASSTDILIARFIGPTWGPSGADRTKVGSMLAPWTLLSGSCYWLSFSPAYCLLNNRIPVLFFQCMPSIQ